MASSPPRTERRKESAAGMQRLGAVSRVPVNSNWVTKGDLSEAGSGLLMFWPGLEGISHGSVGMSGGVGNEGIATIEL